jgi:2-hydroxychromene-2-carboxylate isomerase
VPTLYFDLGSPYAYLAFMRADSVFERMPELAPILSQGAGEAFARAAFLRSFAVGEDITGVPSLAAIAEQIGLSGSELERGVATAEVKDALRAATDAAWETGVRGVPTVRVGAHVFYGDDQLERAAGAV